MTRQEVFCKVVRHARKQGRRSLGAEGTCSYNGCRYRGPNGTKCFIGALIPDMYYSEDFEGCRINSPKLLVALTLSGVLDGKGEGDVDVDFLTRLQGIHDSHDVPYWEEVFEEFALVHKLKYSPPRNKKDKRMTRQEIFDKVVAHARAQKCKSEEITDGIPRCMYRHPNGSKCFVGALIPDKLYDASMEGKAVSSELVLHALDVAGVLPNEASGSPKDDDEHAYISLLSAFQAAHDHEEVKDWEREFQGIARALGLKYSPPEDQK